MPTVIIGNNTGDDYSGTADNHIRSGNALYNYGSYSYGYTGSGRYVLIKFPGLSNINGPVTVSSAVLRQYRVSAGTAQTEDLRRLLRNWIEGSLSGSDRSGDSPYSSCYNEYGSGNSWTTAGGLSNGNDRVGTVSASIENDGSAGYTASGDLSSDVEGFINGTYSNYGWHETSTTTAVYAQWQFSTATDGQRPYLSVTYTEDAVSSLPAIINNYRQQGVM